MDKRADLVGLPRQLGVAFVALKNRRIAFVEGG
jgi:hypothetical protein